MDIGIDDYSPRHSYRRSRSVGLETYLVYAPSSTICSQLRLQRVRIYSSSIMSTIALVYINIGETKAFVLYETSPELFGGILTNHSHSFKYLVGIGYVLWFLCVILKINCDSIPIHTDLHQPRNLPWH